jgi:shikimate 5-dehydrogenase
LFLSGDEWCGHNTDIQGFRALMAGFEDKDIVVWGGGGTRKMMKAVLPQAHFYSARTGAPLEGASSPDSPQVVVWGVPPSRRAGTQEPPASWRPKTVIDLNYGMNSPGRDYAFRLGCDYRDGLAMFRAQAEAQRDYWGSMREQSSKKEKS